MATIPGLYHDVLRLIFEQVDGQPGEYIKPKHKSAAGTWASSALVCRQWTTPAQLVLYRRVFLTIMSNPSRNVRAILFARTMHSSPHLRALLRHFSLTVEGRADLQADLVDWMHDVPVGSLRSLESSLKHREQPAQVTFCRAPAIRHVKELTLRGHQPPEFLRAIGSFPNLEKVKIQFDDLVKKVNTWDGVEVMLPPTVRTVDINACTDICLTGIVKFIRHAASARHVRVLAIRLVPPLNNESGGAAVAEALLSDINPGLREFRMSSLTWKPERPFMDDLVLRTPELERLEIVLSTFTNQLFFRLPATLKSLTVSASFTDHSFPYEAGLVHLLERVKERKIALTEIAFHPGTVAIKDQLVGLPAACHESGVAFRWLDY